MNPIQMPPMLLVELGCCIAYKSIKIKLVVQPFVFIPLILFFFLWHVFYICSLTMRLAF